MKFLDLVCATQDIGRLTLYASRRLPPSELWPRCILQGGCNSIESVCREPPTRYFRESEKSDRDSKEAEKRR